jgi:hypothetical protein
MGILLYELCYGRHPFANKKPEVMSRLILSYPVCFPDERKINSDLEQLIIDLLQKDWG